MEASVADCVLGVTELLENILLKLSIRDIFQVQRVCKQWKVLIDTSPSLQEAMWLATLSPSSPPTEYETITYPNDRYPPFFNPSTTDERAVAAQHLNPFLPQRSYGTLLKVVDFMNWGQSTNRLVIPATDVDSFSPGGKGCGRTSCEKMQVCKPPCTGFAAFCYHMDGNGVPRTSSLMPLHNATGLRLGDVMKAIASLK
ncbi:uncharacterized protein BDZ99DRAFT_461550 [Mytilinidion resinicola]|uniref:F-box domain-containing protein n=1 Tax=Mytilinidion resinicola TaxID=574789 RepID=A0A6A6YRU1_9PEZI|nr:uncharacterized protein BDZ99DRAFT_461550 [Mytilinidion resinicola]KAF2811491.1 hypothetical protein BDZ99DRAFT_461550 [Mytilinidion resinicola]